MTPSVVKVVRPAGLRARAHGTPLTYTHATRQHTYPHTHTLESAARLSTRRRLPRERARLLHHHLPPKLHTVFQSSATCRRPTPLTTGNRLTTDTTDDDGGWGRRRTTEDGRRTTDDDNSDDRRPPAARRAEGAGEHGGHQLLRGRLDGGARWHAGGPTTCQANQRNS